MLARRCCATSRSLYVAKMAKIPHWVRIRNASSEASTPRPRALHRARKYAKYTSYFLLSSVFGLVTIGAGIFVHDAFTYTEKHAERVPRSPLALYPERGGPNNLPIVSLQVDDEDDEEHKKLAEKPKLVIVGGGWGAMGVLQKLYPGDYNITVVSSETFTTFTPLLPSAAVGTVQVRSLVEPIRKIIARLRGHFVQGKAVDLSMSEQLLEVETLGASGEPCRIYIPYDKLIIAVGSTSSTHGVAGLEHCFQLKTIGDAQSIRRRVMDNFETASLPTTTPEERKRLLSFVICGGGPTGVETAAEIYDFCQEDIMKFFPKICREEVSIHVIQSREHILNTYSEAISKVGAVNPEYVLYTKRRPDGETEQHAIPHNFVLWSTGIAMNPFTKRVTNLLPNQVHKKAIEVDARLRVKGAPLGTVYAVGDCATLVDDADRDKNGKIDFEEWEIMVSRIKQRIPMAEDHVTKVRELFEMYDTDADNSLSLNEVVRLLEDIGNKITSLPATAQVASQQGKYIGKKLHKLARQQETEGFDPAAAEEKLSGPFRYTHLGSLAYIGNAAVFDLGKYSFMGGLAAMYAWRSIYWNEQVSVRTRALLMIDWIIRGVWGRDLSKL
ncbi:hypothetical protein F5146DRAFT_1012772 [Armillaria mellea]|nr:hypothetical protein F5146DRAFT_1012772 [Armillaria mellea]